LSENQYKAANHVLNCICQLKVVEKVACATHFVYLQRATEIVKLL